jgi:hypothetical protein
MIKDKRTGPKVRPRPGRALGLWVIKRLDLSEATLAEA